MPIVRPPNGFDLVEAPLAISAVGNHSARCPWLEFAFENVKARLRMAAHLMGRPLKDQEAYRVFVEANPQTGEKRLAVSYKIVGDTVTILGLKILV